MQATISRRRCWGIHLKANLLGGGIHVTAKLARVDPDSLVAKPGDNVDDGPRPQDDHGVALVGAHQEVGVVVEVHVEAAGEGVAEGGDGGAGDVGGQDDLTRLLTQTTGSSLELGLVVFVV